MKSNLITLVGWFALIGFVTSNDQHFIPFGSPLRRSYYRRLHPFHPINDDDSLSPFLITRPPKTSTATRPNEKLVASASGERNENDKPFKTNEKNRIFDSFNFWNVSDKPVMANGHVVFIPNGDSIYMNGFYNGYKGSSHRARIPNYANIQFETCDRSTSTASDLNKLSECSYALDTFNAVFRSRANFNNRHFIVEQIQYAHRYYDRAIVNRIQLQRNQIYNNSNETFHLTIKLIQPKTISNKTVLIVDASSNTLEDPLYQHDFQNVSILYERVLDQIDLPSGQLSINFTWITIVARTSDEVQRIFEQMQTLNSDEIYQAHTTEWHHFWHQSGISVDGDDELLKTIQSSLYALASSLPSLNASEPRSTFYGSSPSGLGLGKLLTDYQGHSFWDTEIWMHPTILLLEPKWSRELLNYRYLMRDAARDNAITTGYKGYRYPWESAFTGRDVTQSDYPEIVKYQQNITADTAHALRQHFFGTHDFEWFRNVGCDLAYGTAQFWENRVQYNVTTNRYDINGIMGPDEDHYNINNNAYTNVGAALNLHFASYASCFCHQLDPIKYPLNMDWSSIAKRITLLYDQRLDYNPQYDGYTLNLTIKQADVTLLGYSLQFTNIRTTTRRNNLNLYANVTRTSGPAMTWSMHLIGHLEVDSVPPNLEMFKRTHQPYVRKPFYVWNEYIDGVKDGASNFITGAGGFLRLIIYGYAGIRLNVDSLTMEKMALPPNTTQLKLNGISYMQSRIQVIINEHHVHVNIRGNDYFNIFIDNIEQEPTRKTFVFNREQAFKMKPAESSHTKSCALPEDTIDPLVIN